MKKARENKLQRAPLSNNRHNSILSLCTLRQRNSKEPPCHPYIVLPYRQQGSLIRRVDSSDHIYMCTSSAKTKGDVELPPHECVSTTLSRPVGPSPLAAEWVVETFWMAAYFPVRQPCEIG